MAFCEEKWTYYKNMIPSCSKIVAIIILILNILFPGLGTVIMGCVETNYLMPNLLVALCQFLLAFLVIGWIWSIVWGVFCVMKMH